MQSNLDIFITNLDKRYIENKKTGEIKNFCMITYLVNKESTSRSKGLAQLSCYVNDSAFDDLDKYMCKWCKACLVSSFDEKNNRLKLKIKSVNDVVVS